MASGGGEGEGGEGAIPHTDPTYLSDENRARGTLKPSSTNNFMFEAINFQCISLKAY